MYPSLFAFYSGYALPAAMFSGKLACREMAAATNGSTIFGDNKVLHP